MAAAVAAATEIDAVVTAADDASSPLPAGGAVGAATGGAVGAATGGAVGVATGADVAGGGFSDADSAAM